jgi:hypothetical protein
VIAVSARLGREGKGRRRMHRLERLDGPPRHECEPVLVADDDVPRVRQSAGLGAPDSSVSLCAHAGSRASSAVASAGTVESARICPYGYGFEKLNIAPLFCGAHRPAHAVTQSHGMTQEAPGESHVLYARLAPARGVDGDPIVNDPHDDFGHEASVR